MKFILIVAFLTGNVGGGTQGVAMQEFDSKQSCQDAGAKAFNLAARLHGGAAKQVAWECVAK